MAAVLAARAAILFEAEIDAALAETAAVYPVPEMTTRSRTGAKASPTSSSLVNGP